MQAYCQNALWAAGQCQPWEYEELLEQPCLLPYLLQLASVLLFAAVVEISCQTSSVAAAVAAATLVAAAMHDAAAARIVAATAAVATAPANCAVVVAYGATFPLSKVDVTTA